MAEEKGSGIKIHGIFFHTKDNTAFFNDAWEARSPGGGRPYDPQPAITGFMKCKAAAMPVLNKRGTFYERPGGGLMRVYGYPGLQPNDKRNVQLGFGFLHDKVQIDGEKGLFDRPKHLLFGPLAQLVIIYGKPGCCAQKCIMVVYNGKALTRDDVAVKGCPQLMQKSWSIDNTGELRSDIHAIDGQHQSGKVKEVGQPWQKKIIAPNFVPHQKP